MIKIDPTALQSIHLKKTETVEHTSTVNETVFRGQHHINYSEEQEKQTREYFFSAGIDEWYNSLKDCTFPSAFAEITIEECREVIRCYEQQLKQPFPAYDPLAAYISRG